MYTGEAFYWWCTNCSVNVDILLAPGVGLYCILCGTKVKKPKNRPGPGRFYISESEVDNLFEKW